VCGETLRGVTALKMMLSEQKVSKKKGTELREAEASDKKELELEQLNK